MKGKVRYGIQLSDNMIVNSNGYLECYNAPIARTGEQIYLGHELSDELEVDKHYTIKRIPKHVFSDKFMASLNEKDLVVYHPDVDVTIDNVKDLSKGHIQANSVRKGNDKSIIMDAEYYDKEGNNTIYCDITVKDKETIQLIRDGVMRELSVGYDAEYYQIDDYALLQVPTNGNHLALVPKGRAGTAKIRDAISDEKLHNCEYLAQELPWPYEGGFKKEGITEWEIKEMSADEYFDNLVTGVKTHLENEARPISNSRVDEMVTSMIAESNMSWKPTIPILVFNTSGDGTNDQDGRHRVAALEKLGITNIPVLIVHKTQKPMRATKDSKEGAPNEMLENKPEEEAANNVEINPMEENQPQETTSVVTDIEPGEQEEQEEFINRFMSNNQMEKEYPDEKQRVAVAYSTWRSSKGVTTQDGVIDKIIIKTSDTIYEFRDMTELEAFSLLSKVK